MGVRFRVEKNAAARSHQLGERRDDGSGVRDVFQHLHAAHHVVGTRLRCGQFLGGGFQVTDPHPAFQRVQARHLQGRG